MSDTILDEFYCAPENRTILSISSKTSRSIRREIIALLLICVACFYLLCGIFLVNFYKHELQTEQMHNVSIMSEQLANYASLIIENSSSEHLNEFIIQGIKDSDVTAVIFKGTDGKIICGKRRIDEARADFVDVTEFSEASIARFGRSDSHPVIHKGKNYGTLEVYISDEAINRKLRAIMIEELSIAVIAIFIITVVLYTGLSKYLFTPLSSVYEAARALGEGDFSARINIDSKNEVGAIATSFNKMADRIQDKIGQLAVAEKKYRSLFESIQDVFYREDSNGIVQLVSPSFEKVLGYPPDEVVGKRFADFFILNGIHEAFVSEIFKYGFVKDYDLLLKHRDGRIVTVSINAGYYDEDAVHSGIEGTFRDISERIQVFEEIFRLKSSFSKIIETLPSAIILVDKDLRIELMNRTAEEFCGFLLSQTKGVSVFEVLPAFLDELSMITEVMEKKEPYAKERLTLTKIFESRYYDLQIYPLKSNEDSAVVRFEDVTEKVRMQEALIQSEKMLMVGGLAAGTAHEINNPLATILQNAQNIERRISFDLPANLTAAVEAGTELKVIRNYLERRGITGFITNIREGGARASRIIANMLQFSRRSDSIRELSDLNAILDQSLELAASDYDLRKKYDFRQIAIVKDFADNIPMIPITVSEIEQVVLNIVKNSAYAISESGVADPVITIRTFCRGGYAVVEIEDNGTGMPDYVRKRIFEPFFTTKEVGTGTGLGMSISYIIITSNHNGLMEVWSEPGAGTKITISLPLIKSNQ